jgi:protein phosphatase PTC2/3
VCSSANISAAEFRGPGVRHQFDHDSPDEYELDLDQRARGGYGNRGRIILLGDGTEVLTDSDDTEMFDTTHEEKDTEHQIKKAAPETADVDAARSEREGTPGPQEQKKSSSDSADAELKPATDGPLKED